MSEEFEKFKKAVKVIVNTPKEKQRKPKKKPKKTPKKKGGQGVSVSSMLLPLKRHLLSLFVNPLKRRATSPPIASNPRAVRRVPCKLITARNWYLSNP